MKQRPKIEDYWLNDKEGIDEYKLRKAQDKHIDDLKKQVEELKEELNDINKFLDERGRTEGGGVNFSISGV